MRSLRRDMTGQAAMVDAILFMTIMLIASAVIIGSASSVKPVNLEYSGLHQYTLDYAETLLATEIYEMNYMDSIGKIVNVSGSGRNVCQLLCDEALIQRNGTSSDFSVYEFRIFSAGKALIRPDLSYAISCDGDAIFLSNGFGRTSDLPQNRCASQTMIFAGIDSSITITVYVWVI